ncbi:MAG: serine/threonine-protein kinase [Polyangiales bacterium]
MAKDFGPYTLVQRLGVGGMAETFEAVRHGRSGFSQRVCLKLVRPALRGNVDSIELFEREARLAAKLHHGNIVSVIDFGEIEGTLYMALELIEGADLQVLLDARNRLSPQHVALIGHDLATALEHAHNPSGDGEDGLHDAGGIIHRDISPSNVLVGRHGEVKLTDFGLANVAEGGSRQSDVRGKFPYMAPERLRADPLDGRADLFSLGVVLFEALAGRRPYDGGHDPATIMLIMAGEHPSLHDLAPGTPAELCQIVESLIEPDREKRPQSAAALAEQLEPFVPPPDARRKLGKMATEARSLLAANKPASGGAFVETHVQRTSAMSGAVSEAAELPPERARTSRRRSVTVALWLALAIGVGAAVMALLPGSNESNGSITEQEPNVQEAAAPEEGTSTKADPASEPVAPASPASAHDTSEAQPAVAAMGAARLTVLVHPWGSVWINGKPRGYAPLKSESLMPGRYKISAGRDGPSQSRTLHLRAGDRKTIRFDLDR